MITTGNAVKGSRSFITKKLIMTISTTKLVDNDFHIIVNSNGIGSEEDQTLVDVVNSNNASSEPKVSIANIVYEIQGTGNVTVFFKNDTEKK